MAEVQKQKSETLYNQQQQPQFYTQQQQYYIQQQQQNQYYSQQQQQYYAQKQFYTKEKQLKEKEKTPVQQQQKAKEQKESYLSQLYNLPVPEKGVVFRVQVGAGRKKIDYVSFFKALNIYEKIRMEQHEGWFKYTIGKYDKYVDARDKRNEIWQTTPIKGAFVSAYNNGVRITVQEALMITNQKWVK